MFRTRGENLHSIYILLFLTIAFFFLEVQDPPRFIALFSFDPAAVMDGQLWRLFTYQFVQSGSGMFHMPAAFALFLNLFMLYFLGAPVEEEWGTAHFVAFYAISLVGTALAAWVLVIPLIGTFFVSYALLFVFATLYPDVVLYLIVIPIRVRWLALLALGLLVVGAIAGGAGNIAVLAGCALSYGYFLLQRGVPRLTSPRTVTPPPVREASNAQLVARNRIRFVAIKNALTSRNEREIDRLIGESEREIVPGVNVCPSVDYKPEGADGYCLRCEGFAECSARHLRLNRPAAAVEQPIPTITET